MISVQSLNAATHTYVAKAPCGCVRGALVDIPGNEDETAATVARWIKDGYTPVRLTREYAGAVDWKCTSSHCPFMVNQFPIEYPDD